MQYILITKQKLEKNVEYDFRLVLRDESQLFLIPKIENAD